MSISPTAVGRKYGPTRYTVGLEKSREFSYAISGAVPSMGFSNKGPPAGLHPLLHDEAAGKASPHGQVVSFPTFCVNYAIAPFALALRDPSLGIDLTRVVHGEQEFDFVRPVLVGDTVTTEGEIKEVFQKGNNDFLILETVSRNQRGEVVVNGRWTAVIRH